jgi:hypothetical protein
VRRRVGNYRFYRSAAGKDSRFSDRGPDEVPARWRKRQERDEEHHDRARDSARKPPRNELI